MTSKITRLNLEVEGTEILFCAYTNGNFKSINCIRFCGSLMLSKKSFFIPSIIESQDCK